MSDRSCKMCRKWMASAAEYGDLCYGCCQSELTTLRAQLAAKEREITERDAVIRELVEAGDAAIKGDYSDWDTVTPKALALLGGEKGEGK